MDNEGWLHKFGSKMTGGKGKWVTLLVWIAIVGVLNAVFPQANSRTVENEPNLTEDRWSMQAAEVAKREFPDEAGIPALIVLHREGGFKPEDAGRIQSLTERLEKSPLPSQTLVPPLHRMPAQALAGQYSADQSTLVLPIFFSGDADIDRLKASIDSLKEQTAELFGSDPHAAGVTSGELSARVTGPVGIQIDATGLFKSADVTLLMATVVLVLVLLLAIYRSPVLALIPLVGVGFAYGAISPVLGLLADQGWITYDSQAVAIMTVLLFGAGTDYCLFLIARFRQELKVQENRFAALRESISGATGAIAMSGFTVMLSLLALLLARFGSYHSFAIPFSLAILIMMLASITLVPALLAIIGRASFWPFIPRTPEMLRQRARERGKPEPVVREQGGMSAAIGKLVTGRPWTVTIATVLLLGGLAVFSAQIKINFDTLSSFPEDMPSREGFALIGQQFSQGELAPAKVIVDTEGREVALKAKLENLDYVAKVGEGVAGKVNPQIMAYDVEFKVNPYSNEAMSLIPELRTTVQETLTAAGVSDASGKLWVGGRTAEQYDTKQMTIGDTLRIIPVIILLIALLLVAYLRSVTAMLYLIGTVLLSYFSALGLGWLIIHYGMGAEFITGSIPLYAFVFLVALGEDYNIFMISSIWQKRKSMPLRRAIAEGVAQTGSVITSAGLILAGTFAVLASMPIQVLVHFGLITALGVLLDTFVVRPFLVPAITTLLGRRAFWPGRYEPVAEPGAEAAVVSGASGRSH